MPPKSNLQIHLQIQIQIHPPTNIPYPKKKKKSDTLPPFPPLPAEKFQARWVEGEKSVLCWSVFDGDEK